MKTSIKSKKGFTIVELVIVIAVIAILAAVLIPTFADLVKRANESVDIQIVRQMNLVLQAEEVSAGKPATVIDTKKILIANGCDDFTPSDSDNVYYWVAGDNRVLLWSNSESKVIFPDKLAKKYADYTEPSADWADLAASADEYIEVVPTEGQTVYRALIAALQNAKDGDAIRLPENSEVKLVTDGGTFSNTYLKHSDTSIGKRITIDLNGGKLISNINNSGGINVPDNGSLTLINGDVEIETPQSNNAAIAPKSGSTLILRNIDLKSNGAAVFPSGDASEVIVDNCTIDHLESDKWLTYGIATNRAESSNIRITCKNSTVKATNAILVNTSSLTTISSCNLIGKGWGLIVRDGYVTVTDSTITTVNGDVGTGSQYSCGYRDFTYTQSSAGAPYWGQGYQMPYSVVTVGDYASKDSYDGTAMLIMNNVKLVSANSADIPDIIVAAHSSGKTVAVNYDSNTVVNSLIIFGQEYSRTGVTHTFEHNGTITVNGETKTLGD